MGMHHVFVVKSGYLSGGTTRIFDNHKNTSHTISGKMPALNMVYKSA